MNLNYVCKHQHLFPLLVILYSVWILLCSFYDLPSNKTEQLHENITASVQSIRLKRTADSFDDEFKLNLRGLDLYRYRWTILERDFCSKRYPHLFMLIVVHTAVPHFKERQAIREMWGDIRLYYKVLLKLTFYLSTFSPLSRSNKQP
ncbi:hypothetical protein Tcan_01562 [Toxocara canis]|uniref:Hexosyltransferase n=1 Tax=Toxocara canis TaxID=6265 RepID=A0A0B2UYY8_TOXCA|nr:hypothetical protein Tcan_01562 [Toxocara canis]